VIGGIQGLKERVDVYKFVGGGGEGSMVER